jgi:ribosomal protein S18 acetylase RimI-like enzyme
MVISPACPSCYLQPINLRDNQEYLEFQQQRVVCGWNFEDETLSKFRDEIDAKLKSLFWIMVPAAVVARTQPSSTDPAAPDVRVGHISLDSIAHPPDPSLAQADRSILTISTFFIAPAYRSLGAGRAAMDIAEAYAITEPYGSPNCKAIAVNTASRRYAEDDGPEWNGLKDRLVEGTSDMTFRKGGSNEDWYTKRGYVKYKEELKYPAKLNDGTELKLLAVFLKKTLQ